MFGKRIREFSLAWLVVRWVPATLASAVWLCAIEVVGALVRGMFGAAQRDIVAVFPSTNAIVPRMNWLEAFLMEFDGVHLFYQAALLALVIIAVVNFTDICERWTCREPLWVIGLIFVGLVIGFEVLDYLAYFVQYALTIPFSKGIPNKELHALLDLRNWKTLDWINPICKSAVFTVWLALNEFVQLKLGIGVEEVDEDDE